MYACMASVIHYDTPLFYAAMEVNVCVCVCVVQCVMYACMYGKCVVACVCG
jgi:hypothetical protein